MVERREKEEPGGGRRMFFYSCGQNENQEDIERMSIEHAERGSTVNSDCGAAYNNVASVIGGKHNTVNHSEFFKDPSSGVHTNTVEGRNALLKTFIRRMGTTFSMNTEVLWNYIDHYLWRQWFTNDTLSMQFAVFIIALYDQHGFA